MEAWDDHSMVHRKLQEFELPTLYVHNQILLDEQADPDVQHNARAVYDKLIPGSLNKQIPALFEKSETTFQENPGIE